MSGNGQEIAICIFMFWCMHENRQYREGAQSESHN